jgi:hypothetical protein
VGAKEVIELQRKPMWIGPFHDFIDEVRLKPFDWNGNECVIAFVCRHIEVLTGQDLAGDKRGRFSDAASAYRLMREEGFDDLADLVATYLPEYEHPSEAELGDIVTIPVNTPFKHALGIINHERVLTMTEARGIGTVDRSLADRAFRVG